MDIFTIIPIVSVIVGVIIVVTIVIAIVTKPKEGFVSTTQGGRLSETGAIRGPNIITDGTINRPWSEMVDQLNKTGYTDDGKQMLGATVGDNFDGIFKNQLDIIDITKRATDGVFDKKDLGEISGKISSAANNASHNIYTRGGAMPVKMYIAKNEIRGVIESKYLPERDRDRKLAAVDTIVHVQGFDDVNVENIGQSFINTKMSSASNNKKKTRISSAAGATGGGGRFTKNVGLESARSANFDAIQKHIKVRDGQINIVKNIDADGQEEIVTTPLKNTSTKINEKVALGNELIENS